MSDQTIRTTRPAGRQAGFAQGLVLTTQSILPTLGVMLLVPSMPLIFAEYGQMAGAAFWIPTLLTAPALCIALFSPVAGSVSALFGRRGPLIAALTIYGLAGMAPMLLKPFEAVLASRILLGVAEAGIMTLSVTMISDYFEGAQRARWLSLISTLATASAVAFVALAGVMADIWGWRGPLAVYALSLMFAPAMLWLTWEPKPETATKAPKTQLDGRLKAHLALAGLVTLVGGVLFYSLVLQLGLMLGAVGTTNPGRIGLLSGLASLGTIFGSLTFWRVSTWPVSRLLFLEFVVIGAAMIVIGPAQTETQIVAATFAGLFGCGLMMPTMMTWTLNGLPFEARALGAGVFQATFIVGQFASAMAIAVLSTEVVHSYLGAIAAIGVFALAMAALGAAAVLIRRSGSARPRTAI